MKRDQGIHFWPDNEFLLLELLIVDGDRRWSWLSPTYDDVLSACEQCGLPFGPLMKVIEAKAPDTHTILIDVPRWLAHLGMRFCNGERNCPADKHANDCPKWEE